MRMKTKSIWGKAPKRIYKMATKLQNEFCNPTVCIVGCSDGKFVFPFLRKGIEVTGYDIDEVALYGGIKKFPVKNKLKKKEYISYKKMMEESTVDYTEEEIKGLLSRIRVEGLNEKAHIEKMDFYGAATTQQYSLVFTSCSLHYKYNLRYGISHCMERLKSSVTVGGYLYVDYMMAYNDELENMSEMFLRDGQMITFFDSDEWKVLYVRELHTPVFEAAHVDCLRDHFHRYGYVLAQRRERPAMKSQA